MSNKIEALLNRVDLFDDSAELAGELGRIADGEACSPSDRYFLKESAESVLGMHELLKDIAKELKTLRAEG